MSVKTKLARQAVKTTAKHTARGAAAKAARKPFRSATLLGIGAAVGVVVGWMIGRSGGGDGQSLPPVAPSGPTSVVTIPADQAGSNSSEGAAERGTVS